MLSLRSKDSAQQEVHTYILMIRQFIFIKIEFVFIYFQIYKCLTTWLNILFLFIFAVENNTFFYNYPYCLILSHFRPLSYRVQLLSYTLRIFPTINAVASVYQLHYTTRFLRLNNWLSSKWRLNLTSLLPSQRFCL